MTSRIRCSKCEAESYYDGKTKIYCPTCFASLKAENDRHKVFWNALCEHMFEGWEMPPDFFLDKGEECGLLVKEIYDPEGKHKDINVGEVIPGDECYFNIYALGGE